MQNRTGIFVYVDANCELRIANCELRGFVCEKSAAAAESEAGTRECRKSGPSQARGSTAKKGVRAYFRLAAIVNLEFSFSDSESPLPKVLTLGTQQR